MRVPLETLRDTVARVLMATALSPEDQAIVCNALVDAECTGRHGHGMNRLPAILDWSTSGGSERIHTLKDQGSTVALDGGGVLGILVAHRAAELACERLENRPIIAIGCCNCRHTNAIGQYAEHLARAGYVGLAMSHCVPLMAPHDGHKRVYGTNPIALACPGPDGPLLADLSPAQVTYGSLINARLAQRAIPEGTALDAHGNPTTDPAAALNGGAMLPAAGQKGTALAFLVQVMAGALAGAAAVPERLDDFGFFLVGFRTDAFGNADQFTRGIAHLVDRVRDAGGRCPGAGSAQRRGEAARDGIPVDPAVWAATQKLAGEARS